MPLPFSCLLFDLDGTLVDSLPDLTTAINRLRSDLLLEELSISQVRQYVGDGATALVQRALPEKTYTQNKLDTFLKYYQQNLCELSRPYPGITAMLEQLNGHSMAVVTNKPRQMAIELLDGLNLSHYFRFVLGGDSFSEKKPHPDPLLKAMDLLNSGRRCIMIGDHHTDIRAAKAAGIASCFCRWGYGNDGGEQPEYVATSVAELCELLTSS